MHNTGNINVQLSNDNDDDGDDDDDDDDDGNNNNEFLEIIFESISKILYSADV